MAFGSVVVLVMLTAVEISCGGCGHQHKMECGTYAANVTARGWERAIDWKSKAEAGDYRVMEFDTPNVSRGKKNDVKAVVLHHTACDDTETSFKIMTKPTTNVSTHVLIAPDGTRYILAKPEKVTWHAGYSYLNGRYNANDFAIGIEFQGNTAQEPLTDKQIASAIDYLVPIIKEYHIPLDNIVTHKHIRQEYLKRNPNSKALPKGDITDTEYARFMKALRQRLAK